MKQPAQRALQAEQEREQARQHAEQEAQARGQAEAEVARLQEELRRLRAGNDFFPRHNGRDLTFTAGGKELVSPSADGCAGRWDAATGKQISRVTPDGERGGHLRYHCGRAWLSPDGKYALAEEKFLPVEWIAARVTDGSTVSHFGGSSSGPLSARGTRPRSPGTTLPAGTGHSDPA